MRRRAPWLLVLLTAAIAVPAITLDVLSPGNIDAWWASYVFPLAVLMSTAVGAVLATRRGENPIGWLLLVNGLVLVLSGKLLYRPAMGGVAVDRRDRRAHLLV